MLFCHRARLRESIMAVIKIFLATPVKSMKTIFVSRWDEK